MEDLIDLFVQRLLKALCFKRILMFSIKIDLCVLPIELLEQQISKQACGASKGFWIWGAMNSQKQNGMTGRWIGTKGLMHMFSYSKFCSTHSRDRMGKVCGPPHSWRRGGWGQRAMYVRIFIDYMCKFRDIEQPGPLLLDLECGLCSAWLTQH